MIERPADDRCGGVVDHQRDAERPADFRHFPDREHLKLGIGECLGVIDAGALVGGRAEALRVGRVGETHIDALLAQRVVEEVPGPAIEICGTHHIVAGDCKILDRNGTGGLAGGEGESSHSAFKGRDPLLEHIRGWIHDPRVDVAELLQREQILGVLRAVELVGGGLVDRNRHRSGGWIGPVARVQHDGFRSLGCVAHWGVLRFVSWFGCGPVAMFCCVPPGRGRGCALNNLFIIFKQQEILYHYFYR